MLYHRRVARIVIYTDGACSGNPGPGGWAAIVSLPEGRVMEIAGGEAPTTNNRMELRAAIAALEAVAGRPEAAVVYTDSTYLISGVTRWLAAWKRRAWRSSTGQAVLNRDLWERLDELSAARRERLSWAYVKGHARSQGNNRCDELAVAVSKGRPLPLYDGPAGGYGRDLVAPEPGPTSPAGASRPRKKSGPGVYLSLVDGRLEKHATWDDCRARVHGRSGARFKKVSSPAEESDTLRSWGLS